MAFADRIILNKIDLIEDDQQIVDKQAYFKLIEKRIREINSIAPIVRSKNSAVDPTTLLNLKAFSLERVLDLDPDFLNPNQEHLHDDSVKSIAKKIKGEMNVNKVKLLLQNIVADPVKANNLFRYKGVIAAKGMNAKFVFLGVHMVCDSGFSDDIHYKEGDERECRFVFIGRKLNQDLLFKGFDACMAEEHLRFNKDDLVKCKINGKWVSGVIVKQWDNGNCYQVKIDDKKNSLVYVPIDSDD